MIINEDWFFPSKHLFYLISQTYRIWYQSCDLVREISIRSFSSLLRGIFSRGSRGACCYPPILFSTVPFIGRLSPTDDESSRPAQREAERERRRRSKMAGKRAEDRSSVHSFGLLVARSGSGGDTHTSERPCTCRAPLRPASGSRKRQIYILLPLSSPSEAIAYAASRET